PTNTGGDKVAWGPPGAITKFSAMKTQPLQERVRRLSGSADWMHWKPREPISAHHVYAQAAGLYWTVLTEYVDRFFNQYREGILAHWLEVRRFTQDLVGHSVPYVPAPADPGIAPIDKNETDDPSLPREEIAGVKRAVRPVTRTETADGSKDLENLKQLCRYIIFHATFWHGWVHDRQYDEGGEILYASMGMRNGSLAPESDPSIAPTPYEATMSLITIAVGCWTQYGYVLQNEDLNIPPMLVELLRARSGEFAQIGFDISKLWSRINI
ncbi:MAG: hypothetical protein HYZ53_08480, partial [Planctomycetes bacterium]|nr:hypothetical protein [Planctomycetota bacterium]